MKSTERNIKFSLVLLATLTPLVSAANTIRAESVAQTIFENLDASKTGEAWINNTTGLNGGRAVGFTLGDTTLLLDSIILRLRFNGGECTTNVSLWSKSEEANRPGSLVASMTPYTTTLNSSDPIDVTFTATNAITLAANTTYYLVVRSTKNAFYWQYAASGTYSTGLGTSFVNGLYSNTGNTSPDTWTSVSSVCPILEVKAVSPGSNIPETGATSLMFGSVAILLVGALVSCRRR